MEDLSKSARIDRLSWLSTDFGHNEGNVIFGFQASGIVIQSIIDGVEDRGGTFGGVVFNDIPEPAFTEHQAIPVGRLPYAVRSQGDDTCSLSIPIGARSFTRPAAVHAACH